MFSYCAFISFDANKFLLIRFFKVNDIMLCLEGKGVAGYFIFLPSVRDSIRTFIQSSVRLYQNLSCIKKLQISAKASNTTDTFLSFDSQVAL